MERDGKGDRCSEYPNIAPEHLPHLVLPGPLVKLQENLRASPRENTGGKISGGPTASEWALHLRRPLPECSAQISKNLRETTE